MKTDHEILLQLYIIMYSLWFCCSIIMLCVTHNNIEMQLSVSVINAHMCCISNLRQLFVDITI